MLNQPGGALIPANNRNGKIYQNWQVKTQEAGKDGLASQTQRAIDHPSRCGLTNPFSAGPVLLVSLFLLTRGIGLSSPLTLQSCDRIMVWDEPTPLLLRLCILGLDSRLSQSMFDLFMSADLALS